MDDTLVLLGDVVFHSETLDEILDQDFSDMLFIEKTLWPKKNFPRNERFGFRVKDGGARRLEWYLKNQDRPQYFTYATLKTIMD